MPQDRTRLAHDTYNAWLQADRWVLVLLAMGRLQRVPLGTLGARSVATHPVLTNAGKALLAGRAQRVSPVRPVQAAARRPSDSSGGVGSVRRWGAQGSGHKQEHRHDEHSASWCRQRAPRRCGHPARPASQWRVAQTSHSPDLCVWGARQRWGGAGDRSLSSRSCCRLDMRWPWHEAAA